MGFHRSNCKRNAKGSIAEDIAKVKPQIISSISKNLYQSYGNKHYKIESTGSRCRGDQHTGAQGQPEGLAVNILRKQELRWCLVYSQQTEHNIILQNSIN